MVVCGGHSCPSRVRGSNSKPESVVNVCENLSAKSPTFYGGAVFPFCRRPLDNNATAALPLLWFSVFFLAVGLFFRSFSVFTFSLFCVMCSLFSFEFICSFSDSRIDVLLDLNLWYPATGASVCACAQIRVVVKENSFLTSGPQHPPWGHVAASPHCGLSSPVRSTLMRLHRGPLLEAATAASFSQDLQPPPSPTGPSRAGLEALRLQIRRTPSCLHTLLDVFGRETDCCR